jgi:hypothetical protein
VSYSVEWGGALIGPAIVAVMLVPGFVLIALMVVLIVLAVVVVALAGAIVAAPYLLGSFLVRHWRALRAARHRPALPGALNHYAKRI